MDSHLKKFEADFVDRDEPDIPFWKERHPNTFDEDFPEATGGYDGTRRGLLSSFTMKYLVRQYLQSKPGAQLIEHRALMQSVRQFYEDALNDDEKLQLRRLLISRLQMNKRANQYAKILGLYRVSAIEKWSLEQTSGKYEPTTFRKKRKIFFFFFFFGRVAESRLFHLDPDSDGKRSPYYRKPAQFMGAAMALAGYSEGDVEAAIKSSGRRVMTRSWKIR